MKKVFLTSISMLLVLGLATGCGCSKKNSKKDAANKEPEVKVNTEKEVIKDREVDGIKLTNTSLTTVDGVSTLVTSVTNNSKEDYHLDEYTIIIKDAEGNEIIRIPGYVGDTIKAGETRTINSSVDIDLSTSAKSIEYEVKK